LPLNVAVTKYISRAFRQIDFLYLTFLL